MELLMEAAARVNNVFITNAQVGNATSTGWYWRCLVSILCHDIPLQLIQNNAQLVVFGLQLLHLV